MRLTNTDERTWQYYLRSLDILNGRNTALKLQVNVHDMALTDWRNMCTRCIALFVVVLIDHSNNLLRGQIEEIRLTAHIERRSLCRCNAVDSEVGLPIL